MTVSLKELREQVTRQRKKVETIDTGPRQLLEQLEADLAAREGPVKKLIERRDRIDAQIAQVAPIMAYWDPRYDFLQGIRKGLQELEAAIIGYSGPPFGASTREVTEADMIIQTTMTNRLDTIRENLVAWRAERERIDREIAALEGATE